MVKPILLVEDDVYYAFMAQHVISELRVINELVHAPDGKQALELLYGRSKAAPCLILLDLYMPQMNGIDFLRAVKEHDLFKSIPVVVLTDSAAQSDIAKCFELGAAEYLVKGKGYRDLLYKFEKILSYWASTGEPSGDTEARVDPCVVSSTEYRPACAPISSDD